MDVMLHIAIGVRVFQLGNLGPREGNGASGAPSKVPSSCLLQSHAGHPCPFEQYGRDSSADFFSPWVKKQGQLQPGLWGWEVSGLLPHCDPLKSHIRTALTLPDNHLPTKGKNMGRFVLSLTP